MDTTTKIPGNKAVPYMSEEINAIYNDSMRKTFEGREKIKLDWKYKLGMTAGRTRSTIYRDENYKAQKECHGKNISFWVDEVEAEFKNETELIDYLAGKL